MNAPGGPPGSVGGRRNPYDYLPDEPGKPGGPGPGVDLMQSTMVNESGQSRLLPPQSKVRVQGIRKTSILCDKISHT